MNVRQLIIQLKRMPQEAIVETWNGIEDAPMPATTVELCGADGRVFIGALTDEQRSED